MASGVAEYKKLLESIKDIYSDRILLRSFKIEDSKDFFELAKDDETTTYLVWYPHKTIDDSKCSIENLFINNPGAFAIVLKDENKCIGCIDLRLHEKDHKASFGYVLNRKYWGQGYMTEALNSILDLSFTKLGLNRVESTHYVGNEASGSVMKKCGMQYEGTFKEEVFVKDKFWDVVHYGITKKEYKTT